ncbi:hypothetical protein DBZ45_13645 [Arthrobacter globiformis]|uniref:Sulfurtransferase FdhD n=1 Tax=Arthrobacter globiformis TaxID=1665 RepID=A0A328HF34_ARTGO|nr:hypothetical protein DBZ45_13645 [Arthrobacter globiformis]
MCAPVAPGVAAPASRQLDLEELGNGTHDPATEGPPLPADFDLVAGFLVSEGIIGSQADLVSLRFCTGEDETGRQTFNVVEAQFRPGLALPDTGRHVYTSSSCGICGSTSIEAVRKTLTYDVHRDQLRVPVDVIARLPEKLREAQALFEGLLPLPGKVLQVSGRASFELVQKARSGWCLRPECRR